MYQLCKSFKLENEGTGSIQFNKLIKYKAETTGRNEGSHLRAGVNKWSIVDIVFAIAIAISISRASQWKILTQ